MPPQCAQAATRGERARYVLAFEAHVKRPSRGGEDEVGVWDRGWPRRGQEGGVGHERMMFPTTNVVNSERSRPVTFSSNRSLVSYLRVFSGPVETDAPSTLAAAERPWAASWTRSGSAGWRSSPYQARKGVEPQRRAQREKHRRVHLWLQSVLDFADGRESQLPDSRSSWRTPQPASTRRVRIRAPIASLGSKVSLASRSFLDTSLVGTRHRVTKLFFRT